jgi:hypothetical protein
LKLEYSVLLLDLTRVHEMNLEGWNVRVKVHKVTN